MKAFCGSFCMIIAKAIMATAYITHDGEGGIQRTGIKRDITWKQSSEPVPLSREVELFKANVLYRPGEFGPLNTSRQLELQLECYAAGVTYHQGLCMRKQLLIQKNVSNGIKLKDLKTLKHLSKAFEHRRKSLLDMSREMDLSPVVIFRAILSSRLTSVYNKHSNLERTRIIKSMVNECNSDIIDEFLSGWEFQQMQTAKLHDIVGYSGHESNIAQEWEDKVLSYLDEHHINYLPEDVLRQSDAKSTPDFLILDDLHINNQAIRWIEVKSNYASGLKENVYLRTCLCKQVKKYNSEFGVGAVILKNGFSDTMISKLDSTLLLDGGPLLDYTLLP